mgnify:CR=1 FL=1
MDVLPGGGDPPLPDQSDNWAVKVPGVSPPLGGDPLPTPAPFTSTPQRSPSNLSGNPWVYALGGALAMLMVVLGWHVAHGSSKNSTSPSATTTGAASPTGALIAHGVLISIGPYVDHPGCNLDGTPLTATGDTGAIVGSQPLQGQVDANGSCEYPFSFPVTSQNIVTFAAGSYAVTGPDGHDGQVSVSALSGKLVLDVL